MAEIEEAQEQFRRANFFSGLKATPSFWNEMEDYHFRKESLYNRLFHGEGVVMDCGQSMHVQAEKTKGGMITLIVGTGLAFDSQGRPIFIYEPHAVVFDPKKFSCPCTVYVTVWYEEKLDDFYENRENADFQGYRHRLETARIEISSELDPKRCVEIARVRLEDPDKTGISEIGNSEGFGDPGPNALDYRFVPWAVVAKKGLSKFLLEFMIAQLAFTESVTNAAYENLPVAALRSLQTVATTAKMVLQTAGVAFDNVIHILEPLFSMDHQVMFEIEEWERENDAKERAYSTKKSYEEARKAMYAFGDAVKAYRGLYDEVGAALCLHREVMEGLKRTIVDRDVSSDDIKFISGKMPQVFVFNEERFTLVDTVSMASEASVEAHGVRFDGGGSPTTSNEAFYYPDGALVRDVVKRWIGGEMTVRLKNLVKGRKTLVVRRTDIYRGDYSVGVKLAGQASKTLVVDGTDTKSRWRNLYVLFDEGEIGEFSPEISFDVGSSGRDNSGSIWAYQVL